MTLDRQAADRRRFAMLTGLADDAGAGLPVGNTESESRSQS